MYQNGVWRYPMKVSESRPGSSSVRTTIPEAVAKVHGIKKDSEIVWAMDPKTNAVWIVEVDGRKVPKP